MNQKINKKKVIEDLNWYYLNQTGYRHINGGYAYVENAKLKKQKDGSYEITGKLISGVDNTGDGISERYTDEITLFVNIKNNKIIKDNGN